MITWDTPTDRFYETGLDRGVIYPIGATPAAIDEANYIFNSSAEDSTSAGWQSYGINTGVFAIPDAVEGNYFNVAKSAPGDYMGMRTAQQGTSQPGMDTRPAGARITLQALVRNPVGQTVTSWSFIARDDTNNDSSVLQNITDGAMTWNIPADGVWRLIWVTGTVKTGRTLEGLYISKNSASTFPTAERMHVKKIMINDQEIVPFFNGATPQDDFIYAWTATPQRSRSTRRPNPGASVPWNGLTNFEEGAGGETSLYYRDGRIYLADVDASDFSGKMTAIYWPDEFAECLGIPEVVDGLFVDNQKPKRFHMSYRTLVGSGVTGDTFGYQIHLVYNCMASYGTRSRKTKGSSADLTEFNFDIVATPVKMTGLRPTAHYVIDTRGLSPATVAQLESMLYGAAGRKGYMPTPAALYDLLNFGSNIKATVDADGWVTISGASGNVFYTDTDTANVKGINAVTDPDGTITISQGGNTTIT